MERTTTRQTRTNKADFQTREDNGERRIEGYFAVFGSTYDMWPGASESIDPHAFDEALGDDVRVLINPDDTDAMNAYARNKRGDVNQASFGFDILDEDTEYREDGSVHWTVKKVKLYEVSLCTFPAYRETELQARKADYANLRKRHTEAWKAEQLAKLKGNRE